MPRKRHGLNKHQKRAFREGEVRVSGKAIDDLLELSRSNSPDDRRTAAEFLCPCHVRRRVGAVWEALYRSPALTEGPLQTVSRSGVSYSVSGNNSEPATGARRTQGDN